MKKTLATLAITGFVGVAALLLPTPAGAVTPPDSCFQVDATTQNLEWYYTNEGNNEQNPACPTDVVDIPQQVNGVTITLINAYAFYNRGINAVTFPDTITEIGSGAFDGNNFTSVTLPSGLKLVNSTAFSNNHLTSVTLPSGLETIGDNAFSSNSLVSVQIPTSVTELAYSAFSLQSPTGKDIELDANGAPTQASRDSIWYTRLYTENPANPNQLADGVNFGAVCPPAENCRTGYVLGGHLINPAPTTITYKNQAGDTLRPNETVTGKKDNGEVISDYLVKNGPNIPANVQQSVVEQALRAYYRLGQQRTFTAPTIAGYTTVTPDSPYTMTLASRNNSVDFVYSNQTPERPITPTNPSVPGAPDTGVGTSSAGAITIATIILIANSTIVVILLKHQIAAQRTRL